MVVVAVASAGSFFGIPLVRPHPLRATFMVSLEFRMNVVCGCGKFVTWLYCVVYNLIFALLSIRSVSEAVAGVFAHRLESFHIRCRLINCALITAGLSEIA